MRSRDNPGAHPPVWFISTEPPAAYSSCASRAHTLAAANGSDQPAEAGSVTSARLRFRSPTSDPSSTAAGCELPTSAIRVVASRAAVESDTCITK